MKGFVRDDQLFSLCGLNCGLCPMNLGGHCGGCGNGNQSCKLARCSLEHSGVEYCFQCPEYPCGYYDHIDRYDSFITHHNQISDMAKAQSIGIGDYHVEQLEKIELLRILLARYDDGRRKTFYCQTVNLLPLDDLRQAAVQLQGDKELSLKSQAAHAVQLLQNAANARNISLKLRKKQCGPAVN